MDSEKGRVILVTGGAGFIGSSFIRHLFIEHPTYSVINLDKMTYAGNPRTIKEFESKKNYEFVKGDVCDPELVSKLVKKADIIVNFAAETHVDRSIGDPGSFVRTDVLGTYNLLEAVQQSGKRMVQISTDEVYGSVEKGASSESSPFAPSSPYSSSKAGADLLALSYFKTFGTNVVVTRSANNYGPYHYPEKLIPLFITNALEDKPLPVYGDGMQRRDWLYVEDNCAAIDLVMHTGTAGEAYNIGAGCEETNITVTNLILKALKKPDTLIQHVKDRPGHDRRYCIDSTKIRKLGWKPQTTFEKGLAKTVEWYTKNPQWWKPLKSGEFLRFYKEHYGRLGLQ